MKLLLALSLFSVFSSARDLVILGINQPNPKAYLYFKTTLFIHGSSNEILCRLECSVTSDAEYRNVTKEEQWQSWQRCVKGYTFDDISKRISQIEMQQLDKEPALKIEVIDAINQTERFFISTANQVRLNNLIDNRIASIRETTPSYSNCDYKVRLATNNNLIADRIKFLNNLSKEDFSGVLRDPQLIEKNFKELAKVDLFAERVLKTGITAYMEATYIFANPIIYILKYRDKDSVQHRFEIYWGDNGRSVRVPHLE